MDLVNKQHIALLQVGQQGGQVAGLLDGGAGGDADLHPHLLGHNAGQRGLAQAGRAVEQHMVHRLAPALGRPQIDRQVCLDLLLADIVLQRFGAQADFLGVGGGHVGTDKAGGINGIFLIQGETSFRGVAGQRPQTLDATT